MPGLGSTINEDVNAMIWLGAMCACIVGGALCLVFASDVTWLLAPGIIFCVIAVIAPVMYIMHWVAKKRNMKCNDCCRVLLCLEPERRNAVEYYKAHRTDPEAGAHETIQEDDVEKVEEKFATEKEVKPSQDAPE